MIRYLGERTDGQVKVWKIYEGGIKTLVQLRLDLRNHSPTGFEWGYPGSGPAQLALALLADAAGDHIAEVLHQDFKHQFVARWPKEGWSLGESQIQDWIDQVFIERPEKKEQALDLMQENTLLLGEEIKKENGDRPGGDHPPS